MKANIMITLLAALAALIGVFAIPLSLQISRAREFVSQSDQRVLPAKSWDLFSARLRKRLKWWIVLWGAIVGICFLAGAALEFHISPLDPFARVNLIAQYTLIPLLLWILIAASCFFLAEYIRSPALLLLSTIGLSLAVFILDMFIATGLMKLGLATKIMAYFYAARPAISTGIPFITYCLTILHTAYAWWALRRAKARGDAWFRFPT